MTKIFVCLFFILILFEGISYSQGISATTEDGRKVILEKDGSWKFYSATKSSPTDTGGSYQKPEESTTVFKAKGDKFLLWFNPLKWQQKKSDDSDKPTFVHKDGDIYAMVIAERFTMAPEALKELAIKNALNVAPDTKVVHEESRIVNGKKVLCMRMDGTIDGVQFSYYGYYYAGKAGIVQLLTYTSQNLFSEYESEMTAFLNGLVIND